MKNIQNKQIAFDLDTNLLKKYYPTSHWENAYHDIERFMKSNGFKDRQGSVYESIDKISFAKVDRLIENLIKKHPWINVCMRDCVVTNIAYKYTLNHLFDKNADISVRSTYQAVNKLSEKQHIKELKQNGFQPQKDIVSKMQQLDNISGRYINLKEIRDTFKDERKDVPTEFKKLADEIGHALRSQELMHVSYR